MDEFEPANLPDLPIEAKPKRRQRPNLALVVPTAGDILAGKDIELRAMARQIGHAERQAAKQTKRARELIRRLNASEPSLSLKAANQRRRKDQVNDLMIISLYRNGNRELADQLTDILHPKVSRLGQLTSRHPERLIREFTEQAAQRSRYVQDHHGHRVRADLLDSRHECAECRLEDKRLSERQRQSG